MMSPGSVATAVPATSDLSRKRFAESWAREDLA